MGGIHDQHVGPFDEPFDDCSCLGRFEIQGQSPLVAIVQMPGIVVPGARLRRNLVNDALQITRRRLDLDYLSAEVRQNHGCSWTGDEARKINYF